MYLDDQLCSEINSGDVSKVLEIVHLENTMLSSLISRNNLRNGTLTEIFPEELGIL